MVSINTLGLHIETLTGVTSPLEKPNSILKWHQLGHQFYLYLIMIILTILNYLLLLLTAKLISNDTRVFVKL